VRGENENVRRRLLTKTEVFGTPLFVANLASILDRKAVFSVRYSTDSLRTLAAYHDLYPVRAGVVEDAKHFRMCRGSERQSEGTEVIETGDEAECR
jgi:hypothetical protein